MDYRFFYTGTLPTSLLAGIPWFPYFPLTQLQPGGTMTIGRGVEQTLNLWVPNLPDPLENSKTAVSRSHALLDLDSNGEDLWLTDFGSINGSYIDGVRATPDVHDKTYYVYICTT